MLRRFLQPVSLLVIDEGLGGLVAWVVNDTALEFECTVRVETIAGDRVVDSGQVTVTAPARGSVSLDAEVVLGGFRDLTAAFRFGNPSFDAVAVTCTGNDGQLIGRTVRLVGSAAHRASPEVHASAVPLSGGRWQLEVSTTAAAVGVVVDIPGFEPSDNWFDLVPGVPYPVALWPTGAIARPQGTVRLAGGQSTAEVVVADR